MPSKPRPYRPKVKGCYECSQRRISCDRTDPECQKCISKGLKCSGLDIRYRFAQGAAVRGKWTGMPIQCVFEAERRKKDEEGCQTNKNPSTKVQPSKRLGTTGPRPANKRREIPSKDMFVLDFRKHMKKSKKSLDSTTSFDNPRSPRSPEESSSTEGDNHQGTAGDVVPNSFWQSFTEEDFIDEEIFRFEDDVLGDGFALQKYGSFPNSREMAEALAFVNPTQVLMWQPLPDNAPAWKRNLFSHYSDRIAVEMMAIDGPHNGWRHLVLPMAHADDLIMNAVLTVSAFHVSYSEADPDSDSDDCSIKPGLIPLPSAGGTTNAEALYEQTIQGLKGRCNLNTPEARHSVVLTILLLLIVVMVTGSDDFPVLFGMLQSVLNAIGGEEQLGGSDMGDFIVRQIRKMRAYAAPLISEQTGLSILASEARWGQCFDCLRWCSQTQPESAEQLSAVINIVQQAHDIYLNQALAPAHNTGVELEQSIARLERFRESLEAFPKNSTGEQVLIWATFMAASDCVLDEHKKFFEDTLMRYHHRSGFGNLLRGLKHLRNIWAKRSEGDVRWTALLPQARMFLM